MEMIDVNKKALGVTFDDQGKANILVWAPLADKVSVVRTTENKEEDIALTKNEYGYWQTVTEKIKPGDTYYFLLNNDKKRSDPASLHQPDGVHKHSQAIDVHTFTWTDNSWQNIPQDNYILYELHTGTFTPQGTFAAIEEKLDHLKELGINAIEIMPVAQFPGSRNWGYDGVFPFAVQSSYGGAKELQHLVNACHEKGLAVVLDVVYNHVGPEGNYFGDFAPYFTDKYHTPWGQAINFDDAWCDGVRRYFIENALMWFRDFHIDALRMDAVHAIKDFSPVHILKEIKQHVDKLMEETGRKHYLIVECDLNDTVFINRQEQCGYGMDGQWMDEFHHALRVTAGGDRNGYFADFSGIKDLEKSYRDVYVYDGQYSPHRHKHFGTKTDNPGNQFVVFSQNHDQVGNRMLGERTSELMSFEMQKLMAAAVMVSAYIPLLFMGEEWSEPNRFQYFVSHTDPELAEAVRKGRKAEFAAFHAQGEAPDPMAEETFNSSKLQWDIHRQEPHATMLNYYKSLIALRKQYPALHSHDRNNLSVSADEKNNTLQLTRWQDNNYILCLMNFSKQQQALQLAEPLKDRVKIFDSAAPQWKGPLAASDALANNETVTLQPESILIYTDHHV